MGGEANRDKLRLGFMTALEIPQRGFVGGLLVTNHFGRPLEFQCTTPVKPNRTQELLYGPTLVPFIIGELIGHTLFNKVGVKPQVIITDRPEILELRGHVSIPVVCFEAKAGASQPVVGGSPSQASGAGSADVVQVGEKFFRVHQAHHDDGEALLSHLQALAGDADLTEPIDRVREALNETMAAGAAK